jgi:hypothetical protein
VIEDVELFFTLLSAATAAISLAYFLLSVADGDGGEPLVLYRERVYAYELYHQLLAFKTRLPAWMRCADDRTFRGHVESPLATE